MPNCFPSNARNRRQLRNVLERALSQLDAGLSGGGVVANLEETFLQWIGAGHALAVSSGTAAIEVALRAAGVGPGDEVITSSYDWGAAAGAILRCGATPVFADVDWKTGAIDANCVRPLVTPRTTALVVTHLAGCPANLDGLMEVAQRHKLFVLEDACQALGARYRARPVGAWGDAAAFSFGPAKLLSVGEGGMLVVRDAGVRRRAVQVSQHPLRQLAQTGELGWGDLAMNARIHPLAAALAIAQWPAWPRRLRTRRRHCKQLSKLLTPLVGLYPPNDPEYGEHAFHRYVLLIEDAHQVAPFISGLLRRGIAANAGPIEQPLHLRALPFRASFRATECPVAERRCRHTVGIELPWFQVTLGRLGQLAARIAAAWEEVQSASTTGGLRCPLKS